MDEFSASRDVGFRGKMFNGSGEEFQVFLGANVDRAGKETGLPLSCDSAAMRASLCFAMRRPTAAGKRPVLRMASWTSLERQREQLVRRPRHLLRLNGKSGNTCPVAGSTLSSHAPLLGFSFRPQ